jgi:hypothetical protein
MQKSGVLFQLMNIGNRPALGNECRLKAQDSAPIFSESTEPRHALAYLEAHFPKDTDFKQQMLVGKELHCLYRSLSGQRYLSVTTFMGKGTF